jgi:hypothetical protein
LINTWLEGNALHTSKSVGTSLETPIPDRRLSLLWR